MTATASDTIGWKTGPSSLLGLTSLVRAPAAKPTGSKMISAGIRKRLASTCDPTASTTVRLRPMSSWFVVTSDSSRTPAVRPHPLRGARPATPAKFASGMADDGQAASQARYGLLLLTLIAAFLFSAATQSHWGGAVHVAFVAMIVLLAVRHIRLRLRPRAAALAVGALLATAVAAGACTTSGNRTAEGISDIWTALMLLLT